MEPRPPTILIVEDHRPTRRFLADNLAADGYEPLEAESASEGLRLMITKGPDLAVVDLGLPDRDGLDLLREIRTADETASRVDPRLPMILLTGRSGELDRVRGFDRGCDDYLVKRLG
jgi:DNA-binding response OmpR family regulator